MIHTFLSMYLKYEDGYLVYTTHGYSDFEV